MTGSETGKPDTDYQIELALGVFMYEGLIESVFHKKCRDGFSYRNDVTITSYVLPLCGKFSIKKNVLMIDRHVFTCSTHCKSKISLFLKLLYFKYLFLLDLSFRVEIKA